MTGEIFLIVGYREVQDMMTTTFNDALAKNSQSQLNCFGISKSVQV